MLKYLTSSPNYITKLSDIFFEGKSVNVRITEINDVTQRIVASIRQALPTAIASTDLHIGDSVSGLIQQIHAEQLVITLLPSQTTALLSLGNLAHHRRSTVEQLKASLKVGEQIDKLAIVSKNTVSGLLIVSTTPGSTGIGVVASYDQVHEGDILDGTVVSTSDQGAMVELTNGLRGRIHPCDATDDLSAPSTLQKNTLVSCFILHVNISNRMLALSSRPSRLTPSTAPKAVDPEITAVELLKTGQRVRGLVKNIAKQGMFVSLGRKVVARVMIREMFDTVSSTSPTEAESSSSRIGRANSASVKWYQARFSVSMRRRVS